MRFNSKKCYPLSMKNHLSHFYTLNNHILQSVPKNPYLGLTISSDFKWSTHISNICRKASSTLSFLRHNLRHCSTQCRKKAYISLVRSTLEYGAIIWVLYAKTDSHNDRLKCIQCRAARFVKHYYRSRDPGSVTKMLADLDLQTLPVLSKFVGPVGQSDIFYECPTKNVRVPDQMSDRKYKNIRLVDEEKRNTSDHKGQQLDFMSSCCFCRHS